MTANSEPKIPLWRDERFWKIALQVLAVVAAIGLITLLWNNVIVNMRNKGIKFGFDFLQTQASFFIQESLIPYNPSQDPYSRVLLIGLLNSIRIIIPGIILATLLGILAGTISFSGNWLLRKVSQVYVEIIRNTPLLLQLLFWYFAVFSQFPDRDSPLSFLGSIFASKQGTFVPWPAINGNFWLWLGVLIILAIAAFFLFRQRTKLMVEKGASGQPQLYSLIAIALVSLLIFIFALGWQFPQKNAAGAVEGGLRLSIEYSALLLGLVVYTGAYIAEIVRAGIQSVSKGQWEAARALGLHQMSTLRLVVFPQALRVMIPPLNSQYMNIAKNSSLAIAIGYVDFYSVSNTTYNQTGRPVEVMLIIMVVYLTIDLLISVAMNTLNKFVQLQER
ncbi:ABC transporter permease subunit [Oscillatoria sp. FACHB-1406]|uniref:amino acid ABC transporter permease n=1 Tax=Oscillatoria sp. FACHB-1406 TaxID=2692846 RepID=UPI001685D468|nr:ABC transporter permease subunit [Oscillatoria sp. FACHB-1406]MBD2576623.1 ABC transporter permease subunit [Oscillatoria sp. FACHB-1406]